MDILHHPVAVVLRAGADRIDHALAPGIGQLGDRQGAADELLGEAQKTAARLVEGPNFAHMMTKTMLNREWDMSLDSAIEAEAQAQALCMQTADFERAFKAFAAKEKPVFEGN